MPYIGNSPGTGTRNRFIYTATASQTTFSGADDNGKTLKYADSDYVDVYLNGICLVPVTDYTSTSKTSIVLTQAASLNDTLEVVAYDIATISDTVSKADGGTFDGNIKIATTSGPQLSIQDTDNGFDATTLQVENGGRDLDITVPQDIIFTSGSDEAMRILSGGNVGINIAAPSNDLHILGKDTDTSTGITIQTDDTASAVSSITLMSRNISNVNKVSTIKNVAGTIDLEADSAEVASFAKTQLIYNGGNQSYSDNYSVYAASEAVAWTSTTSGGSQTITLTNYLPYQKMLPVTIALGYVGNGAISFTSQYLVENAFNSNTGTNVFFNNSTTSILSNLGLGFTGAYNTRRLQLTVTTAGGYSPSNFAGTVYYGGCLT